MAEWCRISDGVDVNSNGACVQVYVYSYIAEFAALIDNPIGFYPISQFTGSESGEIG